MSRPLAAEALGTFLMLLVGGGAAAWEATHGGLGTTGVALLFGAIVGLVVWALGPVSGAHLNPVVTLAFLLRRDIAPVRAWAFVVTQVSAAALGALAVVVLVPDGATAMVTRPAARMSWTSTILVEAAVTALLVFVILLVATAPLLRQWVRAVAIGAAVFVGARFAGPLTGGSMNPARSIGPALVVPDVGDLWLYAVGPLVGALFASGLHAVLVRAHRRLVMPSPEVHVP